MIILNIISSEAPQILQILDSTPLALWRGVGGEAFWSPPARNEVLKFERKFFFYNSK